jgi:hypothetical protein
MSLPRRRLKGLSAASKSGSCPLLQLGDNTSRLPALPYADRNNEFINIALPAYHGTACELWQRPKKYP